MRTEYWTLDLPAEAEEAEAERVVYFADVIDYSLA
jgi:hypothetical protein